jgi:transcriptional regulator with XRE-family HTH domain
MPIDLVAEPLNTRVVEAIRLELARQRLSQAELARLLGHNQTYVSWRLTGRTELKLSEVQEIADVLEVPVEQLLTSNPLMQRRRRAGLWLN